MRLATPLVWGSWALFTSAMELELFWVLFLFEVSLVSLLEYICMVIFKCPLQLLRAMFLLSLLLVRISLHALLLLSKLSLLNQLSSLDASLFGCGALLYGVSIHETDEVLLGSVSFSSLFLLLSTMRMWQHLLHNASQLNLYLCAQRITGVCLFVYSSHSILLSEF
jgi:hypothetical protein